MKNIIFLGVLVGFQVVHASSELIQQEPGQFSKVAFQVVVNEEVQWSSTLVPRLYEAQIRLGKSLNTQLTQCVRQMISCSYHPESLRNIKLSMFDSHKRERTELSGDITFDEALASQLYPRKGSRVLVFECQASFYNVRFPDQILSQE